VSLHPRLGRGPAVGVPDRGPTPEETATLVDLVETFLAGLDEDDRRAVELVLAGERAEAAAKLLRRSRRTVYRALERSRRELLRLEECP
jgi:DNA-directed RNA polymerase specialized sigma24 family protein